jgi:hypothetical protein
MNDEHSATARASGRLGARNSTRSKWWHGALERRHGATVPSKISWERGDGFHACWAGFRLTEIPGT